MPYPGVKALLFDYAHTLLAVSAGEDWEALLSRVRMVILPLLADVTPPGYMATIAERVLRGVIGRFETSIDSGGLEELDIEALVRAVLEEEEVWLPEGLLNEVMGLDSGALAQSVYENQSVSAEVRRVLRELRRKGYLLAVVSNSGFRRDWLQGVPLLGPEEDLVDAVILSADVGYRKPHKRIYRAALEALGVAPEEALFVGDRLLEDVRGPKEFGIPWSVLTHEFRQEPDDLGESDGVIQGLSELVDLL